MISPGHSWFPGRLTRPLPLSIYPSSEPQTSPVRNGPFSVCPPPHKHWDSRIRSPDSSPVPDLRHPASLFHRPWPILEYFSHSVQSNRFPGFGPSLPCRFSVQCRPIPLDFRLISRGSAAPLSFQSFPIRSLVRTAVRSSNFCFCRVVPMSCRAAFLFAFSLRSSQ